MARVTAGGVTFGLSDSGAGDPPFVFLHGLACNRSVWQHQVDDLARDHRCVAIDFRGCGESPAVPPYHAGQQADDAAAVIRELGLGPAIVVAHSLGGIAALLLNERHPELVLGLVLGEAPLRQRPIDDSRLAAAIREQGSTAPLEALLERLWGADTPDAVKTRVRDLMLGCSPEVAAGMLSNEETFATRLPELLRLADVKPFMAIWAERPFGEPAWLRDVCVFIRQEPIAGTGHFFQLERPAITNALLRAFLDDVERDPRLHR